MNDASEQPERPARSVIEILDTNDDIATIIDLVGEDEPEERKASPARRERKRPHPESDDRKLPAPRSISEVVDLSDELESDIRSSRPRRRQRYNETPMRAQESSAGSARSASSQSAQDTLLRQQQADRDELVAVTMQRQQLAQAPQLLGPLSVVRPAEPRRIRFLNPFGAARHNVLDFRGPRAQQPSGWMLHEAYAALAAVEGRRSRGNGRRRSDHLRAHLALQQGDFGPEHYDLLQQLDEKKTQGAKDAVIRTLPVTTVKAKDEERLGECAICLDQMAAGQKVITLPCFHTYHRRCIRRWLKVKADCPICKTELQ